MTLCELNVDDQLDPHSKLKVQRQYSATRICISITYSQPRSSLLGLETDRHACWGLGDKIFISELEVLVLA